MTQFLLDLLFPKRCVSCRKFGFYICPSCQKKIKYLTLNICPVCEKASLHGTVHPVCQTRYSLDGLFSACLYEGVIKKAIHYFKYRPYLSDLATELFKILNKSIKINQDNLITQFINNERPIVVPVPLYKSRERKRGYNQSEILGRLLAKKFNLVFCPDLLVRIKPTKPQAYLKFHQRVENIKNAFSFNSGSKLLTPNFSNILLIDDIWTTGATLKAGANLLKRKGFKKVWGLTLAR